MKNQTIINAINRSIAFATFILAISVATVYSQPANDNFANAEGLNGIRISIVRNNIAATKETGEPNHAFNVGGKSVWFKWTAPMSRSMSIGTARSVANLDTIIAVYSGTTLNTLSIQNSSNDIWDETNLRSHTVFNAEEGHTYYFAVDGASVNGAPAASGTFTLEIHPFFGAHGADQDGDGLTDLSVFRPSDGTWYIKGTTATIYRQWGTNGDIPLVTGEFSGGTTVFRPSTGVWYTRSGCCVSAILQWGVEGDIPVPIGEGDNMFVAVFRPSNGIWYLNNPVGTPPDSYIQFGTQGDIPVPGSYTADAAPDVAVFRPSTGVWYILERRPGGTPDQVRIVPFGEPGDKPASGDYDGDGILDPAIYRPSTGTWWMLRSSDNQQHAFKWGIAEDIPSTGDYDGDGIFDFAVFRPSSGTWYVRYSETGSYRIEKWGINGDIPMTANRAY